MFSFNKGKDLIRKKITLISKNPGVYRMLGKKNEILYVGKAKNLPNRLKNYISEKNLPIRTERMLSQTNNIEITTTSNESEALLLEANLIKKHKPKFNILLRDDKSFPYIFIGKNEKWPQLIKHRGKKTREGHYFGPFASVGSANWTIKTLQKIFLLRVCDDSIFKKRQRPCILYQIKRCSAPCMEYVNHNSYKKLVDNSIKFISGKTRNIQTELSNQLDAASNELDYEKAAVLRDRIKDLIRKKITLISKNPGVYRMLGKKNEILYVGKAKNLPNRLKNYISEKNLPIRTERMLSQTKNIEITTTSNESEAL